jgi:hypothetical protein
MPANRPGEATEPASDHRPTTGHHVDAGRNCSHEARRTIRTATTRALLLLAALAALLLVAGPATAFVVDDDGDDEDTAEVESTDDHDGGHDDAAEPADDRDESPPVGGVDAGLGGLADGEAGGLGAPHAAAATLLALAVGGHALAQRLVSDRR